MIEMIDFVIANANSIVSYEIIDYFMDGVELEFTMNDGGKITFMV